MVRKNSDLPILINTLGHPMLTDDKFAYIGPGRQRLPMTINMKYPTSQVERWITKGYDLFAEDGLEALNVERLSRVVGLNKSGFYHHFGDRDGLLIRILEFHYEQALLMAEDVKTVVQIEQDFLNILIKWKTFILTQQQLYKNRSHKVCFASMNQVSSVVDPCIIPHWARFIGLPDNPVLAFHYYEIVRDMFFARITPESFNEPALRLLVVTEASRILDLISSTPGERDPALKK